MCSSMRSKLLGLLFLLRLAMPAPTPTEAERAVLEERQDFSALLLLASKAAIPIPTDPILLFSIVPIAAELASALPTQPVLSVLETAAPSGFLSAIVHDPQYASTWEAAFSAGSSPSWFMALPTDVRAYLHTYSGYAAVATGVADFGTVDAGGAVTVTETLLGSDSMVMTSTLTIGGTPSSTMGAMMTTSGSQSSGTSSAAVASASTASANSSPSSTSTGAASRQTGFLVAAGMGVFGVLSLAVVL